MMCFVASAFEGPNKIAGETLYDLGCPSKKSRAKLASTPAATT
jgi:hypothetical protein